MPSYRWALRTAFSRCCLAHLSPVSLGVQSEHGGAAGLVAEVGFEGSMAA